MLPHLGVSADTKPTVLCRTTSAPTVMESAKGDVGCGVRHVRRHTWVDIHMANGPGYGRISSQPARRR